jgi:predicted nucleotidyltransferase
MSLSKRHLSEHKEPVLFDPAALGAALRDACPDVLFAFLLGSSRDGFVAVASDIDVAVYVKGKATLDLLAHVEETVSRHAPGVHCDAGVLNSADPIYRYAALEGRRLFARDEEAYLRFFSLTCREYEDQLRDYDRQHRYRMEVA